jgi:type VI secretion system protein ImpK
LEHEVRLFEKVCAELQIRPDHIQNARYCLCSALDEAAMQTDWGKAGAEWSTNSLAVAFGDDRQGGDRVYRIARRATGKPNEHRDLLDVIQNILDLGFKGRYRFGADAQTELEAVRQEVHEAVVTTDRSTGGHRIRPRAPASTFTASPAALPRWQVDPWVRPPAAHAGSAETRRAHSWIAITLMVTTLLCAAGYIAYERLTRYAHPEQSASPVGILKRELNETLKSEIAAGAVSLEENARHSALTLRFSDMFLPGETAVNAWVGPQIATAGREIAKVPGKVEVTGYADSLPVGNAQRATNQTLSEDRANQVMQILLAAGVPADRVVAIGKGDADPIAGNDTPQGRARNRRVDVTVSP